MQKLTRTFVIMQCACAAVVAGAVAVHDVHASPQLVRSACLDSTAIPFFRTALVRAAQMDDAAVADSAGLPLLSDPSTIVYVADDSVCSRALAVFDSTLTSVGNTGTRPTALLVYRYGPNIVAGAPDTAEHYLRVVTMDSLHRGIAFLAM